MDDRGTVHWIFPEAHVKLEKLTDGSRDFRGDWQAREMNSRAGMDKYAH